MPESSREQRLAAVATLLVGMSGTRHWGGSYPTVPTVSRQWQLIETVAQLPHLIVLHTEGSRIRPSTFHGGMQDDMILTVYGYVGSTATVPPALWLERLWWDVLLRLYADHTLGGLCRAIEATDFEADHGAEGVRQFAWFAQDFLAPADLTVPLSTT